MRDLTEWTTIGDGVVRAGMFEPLRGTLTLYLSNGHLYDYLEVPPQLANELATAENPDEVFIKKIQHHYEYRLMSQTQRPWGD